MLNYSYLSFENDLVATFGVKNIPIYMSLILVGLLETLLDHVQVHNLILDLPSSLKCRVFYTNKVQYLIQSMTIGSNSFYEIKNERS